MLPNSAPLRETKKVVRLRCRKCPDKNILLPVPDSLVQLNKAKSRCRRASGILPFETGINLGLLLEPLPLHCWVVQLRVGIAQFPLVNKKLKTLSHAWHRPMPAETTEGVTPNFVGLSFPSVIFHKYLRGLKLQTYDADLSVERRESSTTLPGGT